MILLFIIALIIWSPDLSSWNLYFYNILVQWLISFCVILFSIFLFFGICMLLVFLRVDIFSILEKYFDFSFSFSYLSYPFFLWYSRSSMLYLLESVRKNFSCLYLELIVSWLIWFYLLSVSSFSNFILYILILFIWVFDWLVCRFIFDFVA